MLIFKNTETYGSFTHFDFASYMWEEAEKDWIASHNNDETSWTELTKDEQLQLYSEQVEQALATTWCVIQDKKPKKKQVNSLTKLLKKYLEEDCSYCSEGHWKFATGGYDMWFEIYLDNIPIIQCIDGTLKACREEGRRYLRVVQEVLTYCKITDEL